MKEAIKDKAIQALGLLLGSLLTSLIELPVEADELISVMDLIAKAVQLVVTVVGAVVGTIKARDYLRSRKTSPPSVTDQEVDNGNLR